MPLSPHMSCIRVIIQGLDWYFWLFPSSNNIVIDNLFTNHSQKVLLKITLELTYVSDATSILKSKSQIPSVAYIMIPNKILLCDLSKLHIYHNCSLDLMFHNILFTIFLILTHQKNKQYLPLWITLPGHKGTFLPGSSHLWENG